MTAKSLTYGVNAVTMLLQTLFEVAMVLIRPFAAHIQGMQEKKLVLRQADPVKAYTDFSGYKETSIESRTIVDSRGRVLAQMKLWIDLDSRSCYREVTFLNSLLRASVGLNRVPFAPLKMGKGDTPATMMEVSVRDFEGWLRKRTPGTQFGIEAARSAASKPVEVRVVPMPAATTVGKAAEKQLDAPTAAANAAVKTSSAGVVKAMPPVKAAPAPAATTPKPKVEDVIRGILVGFGVKDRTQGEREFPQYCIDLTRIDQNNEGLPHRVWGTDLERGINESRAKLGDKVEIHCHGSLPAQNQSGGRSQKNCFTMLVLP